MSWKDVTVFAVLTGALAVAGGCVTGNSEGTKTDQSASSLMGSASDVSTGYQPIQSDLIYSVNYDQDGSVLTVVLYEDGVYDFSGVPEKVFRELLRADDPDQFYENSIKPKYNGKKFQMD